MRSKNLRTTRNYLMFAALLFGLAMAMNSLERWWSYWMAIGLILAGLVNLSAGIVEYRDKLTADRRSEENHQAQLDVTTPVIVQERVTAEYMRYLNECIRLTKTLKPEQINAVLLLAPGYIDFVGPVDENETRYYTHREARLVLYYLAEDMRGHTYLPTQHDKARGSRLQLIIKRVTDDLLAKGLAQRTRRNDRAFLIVDRDEAYVGLMEEK